ncbi:MAG: hypothetical protein ACXWTK_02925 [Methylobacter sp.]
MIGLCFHVWPVIEAIIHNHDFRNPVWRLDRHSKYALAFVKREDSGIIRQSPYAA